MFLVLLIVLIVTGLEYPFEERACIFLLVYSSDLVMSSNYEFDFLHPVALVHPVAPFR